jgi:AI-2 transport protein TqsA
MQAEQRLQTICLLLLTTFAVALALYWLSAVLIPFVLAVFLMFAINPLVNLLAKRAKLPRPLAIAAAFLIGCVLFSLVGSVISSSITQLSQNASAYQEKITTLGRQAIALMPLDQFSEGLEHQIAQLPIGSILVKLTNSLLEILSNAILVLVFVVFLLIGGEARQAGDSVWQEIEKRVESYLVTKVTLSVVTGVLVGLLLSVLGVDLALMFGFLAFLLNFIPSIGSVIATLLPLPIILISPESSLTTAVLALALPGTVQFVIGSVIEPRIMGGSLELHPISILLALIFWGVLWGIMGMFLAVPITAVLKILLDQYELTRPVSRLMAGQFH